MKLKDFHETFSSDLQDREFVLGYLQECLEEGGIDLFISALKDVVRAYQAHYSNLNKINEENTILNDFLQTQEPTFLEVYKVLNILGLQLQLSYPTSTVA